MNTIAAALLLLALGALTVVFAQRYRSRRVLVERVKELAALAEAGRDILTAPLDVEQLAERVYRQAGLIVDTRTFQLGLFEGEDYNVILWTRDGERLPVDRFSLTPGNEGIVGWMRRTHQPLLVGDFERDMDRLPARPRYVDRDPPRSAVFVPLMTQEEAVGALSIQSRVPHAFTEAHLRMLAILGNYAAAAMANARLLDQALSRARHQQLLGEVSRQIRGLRPLPDLYLQVVRQLADTLGFVSVRVYEWQSVVGWRAGVLEDSLAAEAEGETTWRTDRLVLQAESSRLSGAPGELAIGEGISGLAAAQRAAVLVSRASPRQDSLAAGAGAALAVPLVIEDRVIGTLEMHAARKETFDPDFLAASELLAGHLALALLENQTYQAERRRAEQLEAIGEVTRAVSSILETNRLLEEVIALAASQLGHSRARIFLRQGNQVVLGGGGTQEHVRAYPLDGAGLIAHVARSGEAVLVPDVREDPRYFPARGWEDTRTEMAVPLIFGEDTLGVFDIQSADRGAFRPDDLQLAQAFAAMLAVALRNAQLFAREREAAWLSSSLLQVAETAARPTRPEVTLRALLALLPAMVGLPCALIWRAAGEPGGFHPEAALGLAESAQEAFQHMRLGLEAYAPPVPTSAGGEGLPAEWVCRTPHALEAVVGPMPLRVFCLKYGGRLLGLLTLPAATSPAGSPTPPANTRERDLLLGIIQQMAAALEAKRLATELEAGKRMERELEVAREIQASLLPKELPHPSGWQVSAFWKAAYEVGGDFYDFFPLPRARLSDRRSPNAGPRWALVIADVADKGVPAALFMALCRTLMRAVAISRIDPAETLTRVNELLFSESRAELFVTAFYGVWEPETGRLLYANAGHNPPLYLPREGQPQWLRQHGVALGVVEGAEYATSRLTIEPGGLLTLYTDGVIDAVNAQNEDFGLARLIRCVTDPTHTSAGAVTEAVDRALSQHVGGRDPFDDVTLVVIRRELSENTGSAAPPGSTSRDL